MLGPYMLLISSSPSSAPYVLTGTGAAIVLFGLFGCFATCRGRPWMLKLVGLPAYSEFVNKCLTKPFMSLFNDLLEVLFYLFFMRLKVSKLKISAN